MTPWTQTAVTDEDWLAAPQRLGMAWWLASRAGRAVIERTTVGRLSQDQLTL